MNDAETAAMLERLACIEAKLDALLEALAEDEADPAPRTLDGDLFSARERDPFAPL